jgi:hypothetical protein
MGGSQRGKQKIIGPLLVYSLYGIKYLVRGGGGGRGGGLEDGDFEHN